MYKVYLVWKNGRLLRAYTSAGHVTLKIKNTADSLYIQEVDISNAPHRGYADHEWMQRDALQTFDQEG